MIGASALSLHVEILSAYSINRGSDGMAIEGGFYRILDWRPAPDAARGIAGVRAVTVTERAETAACAGGHRTTADDRRCNVKPRPRARRNPNAIHGAIAPRLIEMNKSPAYQVLTLSAHRFLARIETEHAAHAGKENGRLPVTYKDFEKAGVIGTQFGRSHGMRSAWLYRSHRARPRRKCRDSQADLFPANYRPAKGETGNGTHEWRRIKTIEEARSIKQQAREASPILADRKQRHTKNRKPVGNLPGSRWGNLPAEKVRRQVGKYHYCLGGNIPTTLYICPARGTADTGARCSTRPGKSRDGT